MRRVIALALLCGVPTWAQPALTPSADFAARLAEMEERRVPIDEVHSRAWTLKVSAGVGYALFVASGLWAVIEGVKLANNRATSPLGGAPYTAPVPPLLLVAIAAVCGAAALAVHITARLIDVKATEEEEALDDEERPIRRQLAASKEESVDEAPPPTATEPPPEDPPSQVP